MSFDSYIVIMPIILQSHDTQWHNGMWRRYTYPERNYSGMCLFWSRTTLEWDHMSLDSHMVTMPHIFHLSLHSAIIACYRDTHTPNTSQFGEVVLVCQESSLIGTIEASIATWSPWPYVDSLDTQNRYSLWRWYTPPEHITIAYGPQDHSPHFVIHSRIGGRHKTTPNT